MRVTDTRNESRGTMLGKPRTSISWRSAPLAITLLIALVSLVSCNSPMAQVPRARATPAPTLTYVAVGASDAFGIGTDDPDRESWPTVLAGLLGSHVHLINLGIPGEVVKEALSMELPVALASRPNVITVWLAVNDFADGVPLASYRAQLQTLLTALHQGTNAQIFVGNIPDLTLIPHFFGYDPGALTAQIQEWNAAIASICTQVGVRLVDIYSAWKTLANHPEYISSDGFHPSAAGARQLAQFFAASIKAASAA